MATVRTTFPGNTALEEQIWTLSRAEAKQVVAYLKPAKGSCWDSYLAAPYRRAVRHARPNVTVYTAGFSTGEFSNILFNLDIPRTAAA